MAASNGDLPKDVMIQIILRLPVKSIVRFKSLSKYWYALLKSESFINTHLLSKCRKSVLLVRRCLLPRHEPQRDDDFDVLSFHDPDSPELKEVSQNLSISPFFKDVILPRNYGPYEPRLNLLGPCDGIICIYMLRVDYIILCNPALREFKRVPKCPFACPQGCLFLIEGIGFGRSSTKDDDFDFKVVLLTNADPDMYVPNFHIMINVYSLSTDSWKQIDANGIVSYMNIIKYTQQLFFNGACHWLVRGPILDDDSTIGEAILCFDLSTEVIRYLECPTDVVAVPDVVNGDYLWENMMILDGCLAAAGHYICEGYDRDIDIWVMKEYGVRESWIKQFVIEGYLLPFLPWKNEWVLMEVTDQLVSYSFRTNQVKRYQFYGQEGTLGALIYQESLISLKQISVPSVSR